MKGALLVVLVLAVAACGGGGRSEAWQAGYDYCETWIAGLPPYGVDASQRPLMSVLVAEGYISEDGIDDAYDGCDAAYEDYVKE